MKKMLAVIGFVLLVSTLSCHAAISPAAKALQEGFMASDETVVVYTDTTSLDFMYEAISADSGKHQLPNEADDSLGDYVRECLSDKAIVNSCTRTGSQYKWDITLVTKLSSEDCLYIENKIEEIYNTLDIRGKPDDIKIISIVNWLVDNIEYQDSRADLADALSEGKGNCQTYSILFYRLAKKAGLEVRTARDSLAKHEWDIIKYNGAWYHIDVTFLDYNKVTIGTPVLEGSETFAETHPDMIYSSDKDISKSDALYYFPLYRLDPNKSVAN